MRGRAFLDVARELVVGGTEAHWRATVIHAYYALFLECRDALRRWGIALVPRQNVHSAVRLRYLYATAADLKSISLALDTWCRKRNDASYNLGVLPDYATHRTAQHAIGETTVTLALLDAIDADPVRRAASIAMFPP